MRQKDVVFIILMLFLCESCVTEMLWKKTSPNAYVKIRYTEITEGELRNSGAKYISDDSKQLFYVEKTSFSKLRDYSYRILATPVTIDIDATAVIILGAAFAVVDNTINDAREKSCSEDPDCKEQMDFRPTR